MPGPLNYRDGRKMIVSEHPNFERAMATHRPELQGHWHGVYNVSPHLLDLEEACPRCGAKPFWPCSTPTGYGARTHAVRPRRVE